MDEVETTNKQLNRLCEDRLGLLKQTTAHLESTEELLSQSRAECEAAREEASKLRRRERSSRTPARDDGSGGKSNA